MSIVYVVLPLALVIVGAAVTAFAWAARRGQFDDLETPALRMLHDDDAPRRPLHPPDPPAPPAPPAPPDPPDPPAPQGPQGPQGREPRP